MSITENDRLDLRQALAETLKSERLAEIAMTAMPPIDYDRLATKDDLATVESALRGDMSQVRGEFAELRGEFAELRGEFADLKGEVRSEIGQLRGEMGELRGEVGGLRGELRGEMGHLRGDLESRMATNLRIMVASQVATMLALASWIAALN